MREIIFKHRGREITVTYEIHRIRCCGDPTDRMLAALENKLAEMFLTAVNNIEESK